MIRRASLGRLFATLIWYRGHRELRVGSRGGTILGYCRSPRKRGFYHERF